MQLLAPALSAAALIAAALDDSDGALGHVRELIALSRDRSDRHRSLFLPELTRMCASAGALDVARELAAGLTADLGRIGCARIAAAAELAEAEGHASEAVELHAEAQRRWRDFGGVPGLAAALLGQGRCLVGLDGSGARPPLSEAHELFTRLGDVEGAAEAARLLAQIG
jgi:hypothetical protein